MRQSGYGSEMEPNHERAKVQLQEHGFEGEVVIEDAGGGKRHVHVSGVRPQDGSNVAKDVPADRDAELSELADQVVAGDDGAPARLLAHLGVTDPPPRE